MSVDTLAAKGDVAGRSASPWDEFLANPLCGVHPDRLAACFHADAFAAVVTRLAAEPRFRERLGGLLVTRFALDDGAPPPTTTAEAGVDPGIAGLVREALDRLAMRCGAVCWAHAFAREIRRPAVEALRDRFGDVAFDGALKHRDLALGRPIPADLDTLEQAVAIDGLGCLAAWIDAQPGSIGRRVRLKWPSDDQVPVVRDAALIAAGPVVVRRLAADDNAPERATR